MSLVKNIALTLTALTVSLQITCTPVFAVDTPVAERHVTRERIRVRREVRQYRVIRSAGADKNSESTTGMTRGSGSDQSEIRNNNRDVLDHFNASRDRANGNTRDTSTGIRSVSSRDNRDSLSGDTTLQRRIVKRLVRVKMRNARIGQGFVPQLDPNIEVASIQQLNMQYKQFAPTDDPRLDENKMGNGGEDTPDGFPRPPGHRHGGPSNEDVNHSLPGAAIDSGNNPAGRGLENSTKSNNNCMRKPNNNCLTKLPPERRYKTDQDEALAAVENGTIMPWKEAVKHLSRNVSGKIIGVRINQTSDRSVYQVKVRTPEGEIKNVLVDAATGQILQVLGY